jgi:hypothetical protein
LFVSCFRSRPRDTNQVDQRRASPTFAPRSRVLRSGLLVTLHPRNGSKLGEASGGSSRVGRLPALSAGKSDDIPFESAYQGTTVGHSGAGGRETMSLPGPLGLYPLMW